VVAAAIVGYDHRPRPVVVVDPAQRNLAPARPSSGQPRLGAQAQDLLAGVLPAERPAAPELAPVLERRGAGGDRLLVDGDQGGAAVRAEHGHAPLPGRGAVLRERLVVHPGGVRKGKSSTSPTMVTAPRAPMSR